MKFMADTNPRTVALLDRLRDENRATDARLEIEDAARRQRELNELIFLEAVRSWFKKTEPTR